MASKIAISESILNQAGRIFISSLSDNIMSEISKSILTVNVSYTMGYASELNFTVLESVDTNFANFSSNDGSFYSELQFANNNYFQIGLDVIYETDTIGSIDAPSTTGGYTLVKQQQVYEIAKVSISPGQAGSPIWTIKCFTKSIQQMKRDRNPAAIKGQGTEFVRRAAIKYGLKFWGEETSKNYTITKASGDKQADSLWDVIGRLASDAKFVVFEVDGYLIFASEKYILGKWGIDSETFSQINNKKTPPVTETKKRSWVPLQFPQVVKGTRGIFSAYEYPAFELAENRPFDITGTIVVDRTNGTQLRPGMTAYVGNVFGFDGFYLIDSVSFTDRDISGVSVSFRKPEKTEKEISKKELPIGAIFTSTGLRQIERITPTVPLRVSAKQGIRVIPEQFSALILPLPTQANQYTYPRTTAGDGITAGNIPLYLRPVLNFNDGEQMVTETTFSITVYQRPNNTINYNEFVAGDTAVILTPIWSISGQPRNISRWDITHISSVSNVVTLTISVSHLFAVGHVIEINYCPINAILGRHTITAVTSTTISFNFEIEDLVQAATTGEIVSEGPTISKYLSDGLFLAKCTTPAAAGTYADLIHQQQALILTKRFPDVDLYKIPPDVYPNSIGST